jgi:hypothetical protein
MADQICVQGILYSTLYGQPSNGLGAETNDNTNYYEAAESVPENSSGPYFTFYPFGAATPCEVDTQSKPQPPVSEQATGLSATATYMAKLNALNLGTTPPRNAGTA